MCFCVVSRLPRIRHSRTLPNSSPFSPANYPRFLRTDSRHFSRGSPTPRASGQITGSSSSTTDRLALGLCIERFSGGTVSTLYVLSFFVHFSFRYPLSRLLQMTSGLQSAPLWVFPHSMQWILANRRGVDLSQRVGCSSYIMILCATSTRTTLTTFLPNRGTYKCWIRCPLNLPMSGHNHTNPRRGVLRALHQTRLFMTAEAMSI